MNRIPLKLILFAVVFVLLLIQNAILVHQKKLSEQRIAELEAQIEELREQDR